VVGLLAASGCSPLEDALNDRPLALASTRCDTGDVRLVAAVTPPLVACHDEVRVLVDGRFETWLHASVTAVLPASADRPWLVVATDDGRVGVLEAGKRELAFSPSPNLLEISPEPVYAWRPRGLEDVADNAVVRIFPVKERLVAITAGAGAMESLDGGRSWQYLTFTPRFMYVAGPAPVAVEDLLISESGQVAFLFYPHGKDAAYANLDAQLAARAEDTEHGGGPHVARGHLEDQRMEVHFVRPGLAHHLVQAPDPDELLWLFVQHPTRHEMTRFIGPSWGKAFLDSGYFDFVGLGATGTARRTAWIGERDDGVDVLWFKGASELNRYAIVDGYDETKPVLIDLEDHPNPRWLVVAEGPAAGAWDLSPVAPDRRLLRIYLPLGLLTLVILALVIRRLVHERRLRKIYEAKAAELRNRGVHWEATVPDSPTDTSPGTRPPDPT